MRKLLIVLGVCVAVTVGSSSVAVAGLEEGFAAYKRGDYATALKEFRALASEGDAVATVAQANLGMMYENGHGVTQDYKEAANWYRKAAEQGCARSVRRQTMEPVINTLHDQHQRMFRLLDALESEIDAFDTGNALDFYIIDGILEYIETYPDRFHRPTESSVYQAMRRRLAGAEAAPIERIESEHGGLGAAVRALRNAVDANTRTVMFPRAFLVEKARDVIHGFRRHMTTEEERIFPLAREILSAEELEGIAFRNGGALADDEEEEQRFDTLYRTIGRQVEIGLGASGT